jgi:hypothetical protein
MVRHFLSPVVTKAVAGFVVGCALLALPAGARAQDPASAAVSALGQGFGSQGQLVLSADLSGGPPFTGLGGAHFDKTNGGGWNFEIRPAADYFIIPAVTLGAVVGFGMNGDETKGVLLGGRAGFNFNLNEHISFWARGGLSYSYVSVSGTSFSDTYLSGNLPILYHFVPHLFVGIGPYYNLNVTGDGPNNYGFTTTIGGWF